MAITLDYKYVVALSAVQVQDVMSAPGTIWWD